MWQVIRKGESCPDCNGSGYDAQGICPTCDEKGVVGQEGMYVRDGWLYLPDAGFWFNPAHITRIRANLGTDDRVLRYEVYDLSTDPGWPVPAESDTDMAAVRAWLEGRA